jgi:hypothetical protein
MAYREKLALGGLCLSLFATIVFALITWGGLDVRDTGHGWLGGLIGIGVFLTALLLGVAAMGADREDDREVLIRLKANNVSFWATLAGAWVLYAAAGGIFRPIPGNAGALICLVMAAFAFSNGARLYFYRRGV